MTILDLYDKNEPVVLCQVCGKPAVAMVRDMVARSFPDKMHLERAPDGPIHYFCDEHDRQSQVREENYQFIRSDGRHVLDTGDKS